MTFDAPIPFAEALEFLRGKNLLPTNLSSAQLRELEAEIRRRAIFSARMTQLDFLSRLKRLVGSIVSGVRDEEEGVHVSIPEAKAQLREELEASGYSPDPEDRDTIKDFLSDNRRQLIVETNVLDTMGYGRWKAEQDPVSMDVNPAWELVRMVHSAVPRDWPQRWQDAGDAIEWDGASQERMIALKTSPIWQALGDGAGPNGEGHYDDTLGNPWPPFAFRSGMGVVQVPRAEVEKLGLIQPDQVQGAVPESQRKLNAEVSASLKDFDAELLRIFGNDPMFIRDRERIRLSAANAIVRINAMTIANGLGSAPVPGARFGVPPKVNQPARRRLAHARRVCSPERMAA